MKVVCIDSSDPLPPIIMCPLVEGEVYEVDYSKRCSNGCCIWVPVVRQCWDERRFVPVSDIDETKLVNTKEGVS